MYKVLIVDDLEILRYDLKRMKIWGDQSGFIIEGEAENGVDALNKLRVSAYDLVITDIRMPIMDGMELLKVVSEEKLCPCVVLLSDFTEYSYAREGFLYGAFDYLGKPTDSHELENLLNRAKRFLDEKKNERVMIKQLEDMAEEAFYPTHYVEKVSTLLIKGQDKALEAADALLDSVGEALNFDSSKALLILENVMEEIFSRVNKEHGWIKQYKNIEDFKRLERQDNQNWQDIRNQFHESYDDLLQFLKNFVIWKEGENPIKRACHQVLFHVEEDISVKNITESLYISKAYLSELFKEATGITLSEYISMVKIERAKYLLLTSSMKAYEIADALGYNDHEYFSKVFKKFTGLSPTVFRREIK